MSSLNYIYHTSQAVTEDALALTAIIARSPVPVPISSTKASFPLLFSKFRAFCNAKLYFKF
jgi:hypothetical protein